jgi:hypothetical protein
VTLSASGLKQLHLEDLLSVIDQHPVAGSAQPFAILLETGQDDEITLVDDPATIAANVAGAGGLLVLPAGMLGGSYGAKAYEERDS